MDGIEGGIQDLIISDCHTNNNAANSNTNSNSINSNNNTNNVIEDDDVEGREFQKVFIVLIYCSFYHSNVLFLFIDIFIFLFIILFHIILSCIFFFMLMFSFHLSFSFNYTLHVIQLPSYLPFLHYYDRYIISLLQY